MLPTASRLPTSQLGILHGDPVLFALLGRSRARASDAFAVRTLVLVQHGRAASRSLALPTSTATALREHRKRQLAERL